MNSVFWHILHYSRHADLHLSLPHKRGRLPLKFGPIVRSWHATSVPETPSSMERHGEENAVLAQDILLSALRVPASLP